MTCEEVVKSDVVENYLHDRLDDESREAFELHYFDCAGCFRLLQTYRELQAELARTRDEAVLSASPRSWIWQWAWLPAAAAVTLAVGLTVWQRPDAELPETPAVTEPAAPSSPARPSVQGPPPVSLGDLARVEPPRYTPGRLRGAGDEATARYQEAMKSYERGDYAAAATGLAAAAVLDPEAPHAAFFLGISHLMTGRSDEAVDALRRTISLGDSPYLEEARFFLAKAYLRQKNIDEARAQLQRTAQMQGAREAEARQILSQLDRTATPAKP